MNLTISFGDLPALLGAISQLVVTFQGSPFGALMALMGLVALVALVAVVAFVMLLRFDGRDAKSSDRGSRRRRG